MQIDESDRYGTKNHNGFYPCKMKASYSLLPRYMKNRTVDGMVEDMNKKSK